MTPRVNYSRSAVKNVHDLTMTPLLYHEAETPSPTEKRGGTAHILPSRTPPSSKVGKEPPGLAHSRSTVGLISPSSMSW